MLKNNIKLIVYQFIVSLIYGVLFFGYFGCKFQYVFSNMKFQFVVALCVTLVIVLSYYFIGMKLDRQINHVKNLLSVIGIPVLVVSWNLVFTLLEMPKWNSAILPVLPSAPFMLMAAFCGQIIKLPNDIMIYILMIFLSSIPTVFAYAGIIYHTDKSLSKKTIILASVVFIPMWIYSVYYALVEFTF